jgi:hypothetical protein
MPTTDPHRQRQGSTPCRCQRDRTSEWVGGRPRPLVFGAGFSADAGHCVALGTVRTPPGATLKSNGVAMSTADDNHLVTAKAFAPCGWTVASAGTASTTGESAVAS